MLGSYQNIKNKRYLFLDISEITPYFIDKMKTERPWNTSISGLVVTLNTSAQSSQCTIESISKNPAITVGIPEGDYLPLTIENTDARIIHRWLESLAGVAFVDVVYCSTLPVEKQEPLTV